ncbi:MobQ family relaxase [Facklamia sp. P12945]|uniref:MobQ family relaxase n=1 Tax=unclassified Facklamia TaxID=2622293 RepID=UPI003D16610E
MAESFHFNISMVSRGKGKSAVSSSAYISREKITNEWDGVTHDYHNKKDLIYKEIFLPENAKEEFKDRATLWNSVELNEKAINAQLARSFIIALPKELSIEENKKLIAEFIESNFVSQGMIADLAIHDESDEGNQNIHAHIMTTVRPLNEDGSWGQKSKKEYVFDEKGEPVLTKSGKQKTRKIELTDWNNRGNAEKWRANFADLCNKYLEENNLQKRVDHRSYERQGRDEIPTIHMGASASALEIQGIETEKGNINREIKKHNSLVKEIKNRLSEINSWLGSLIGKLQSKYDEYKQDKKDELENKAELFNLYEYISIYHDIQVDKRKYLNSYWREKKGLADLKRFASARVYLHDNNLETIADLQGKIDSLQAKNRKVSKEIKDKTEEIDKLNKCLVYADIIKNTKGVYQTWDNKKVFKDSYYKQNQAKIDKYKRVRTYLEKQTGSSAIKPKEWKKQVNDLEIEIERLNQTKENIKDDFSKINHIKYAVKIVNDDYGIDLSIEIDKSVKRGEKPSIIEQIKKFEKQQEKDDGYRQKAREKYQKNEER